MAAAPGLKGKLTVTVHQARDLKDVQLLGKQDPYVTLIIGNETFKTKVVPNAGTTAEWNQAFLFNLTGVEDALHIKVNDKETLIDRPIARCDIGLRELCEKASKGPTSFQLFDVDNFNQMAGQISLSIEFNGTGLATSSTTTPSAVQQTPPMQQMYTQPTQPMQQMYTQPQTHSMQPVYPPQQSVPVQATTQQTPAAAAPSATQQQHDVHKDKDKKHKDKKDKKDKKHKDKKDKKGSKKKKKHQGSHSGSGSDSSSSGSDSD